MIKKSLGQNFFINENLGNQIVEHVRQEAPDIIVEIGPGRGFFTKKLSSITSNLLLIEKDDILAQELKQSYPKAVVLNQDVLDWSMTELKPWRDKKIIFFGSLPYNISKPIIHMIISSKYFNNPSYFIIQKEVALKYTAKIPDNNILAIKTELFATSKKLIDIHPTSFFPAPKVESCLIKLTPNSVNYSLDTKRFITFLETSFRSPRKTLKNNLKSIAFKQSFDPLLSKRPSQLELSDYITLFSNLI